MIADILFEMVWKSTLVSAAVVALLFGMRSQAATSRVAVGGLGLGLLVALPCVVLALSLLPAPIIAMPAAAASAVAAPSATLSSISALPMSPPSEVPATAPPELILAVLWATGALAVLARLGAGILTLRKWTNRSALVSSPRWNATLRSCSAPESTLLMVSDDVSAPLSWGWQMPVILVGRETLDNPIEGEAVIAHESAHLARGDWPRLIAARIVVAIFWFNPFVWLLERLYLQDIEEAADAEATRRVEPANYAQALLNVARNAAVPASANSIASGALAKRIKQVLSGRRRSRWERTWRIGALTSVAAVATPIAVVQFVAPAASAAVAAPLARPTDVSPPAAPKPTVAVADAIPALPPVVAALAAAQPMPAPAPVPVVPPTDIINRQELDRILRDAERARAEAQITAREAQAIAARAQAEAKVAMRDARKQMLRGADEMERAIPQMKAGAATMREEARKLRDPRYRAEHISKARARGDHHVPTDQELIDAIPKMLEGADSMEASIPKMREGAEQMRRSAREQD